MLIDCDTCLGQGTALCADCVVSFILPLTDEFEGKLNLEDEEADALAALADQGLVPRLRLTLASDVDQPISKDDDLAG